MKKRKHRYSQHKLLGHLDDCYFGKITENNDCLDMGVELARAAKLCLQE